MEDVLVGFGAPEDLEIILDADGGATINLGPDIPEEPEFDDNLAEFLDDTALGKLSSDLLEDFDEDVVSRKEWEETFKEGLSILGVKLEETDEPFEGACAAHHPLMLEAALQFQARAISELFPAGGPIKTTIIGARDQNVMAQADRVKEFMNYQLTEEMDEYFDELDTMLFHLPLAGSAFKKTYYDYTLGRAVSKYVPAEKFIVQYQTTNLVTSGRYSEIMDMDENEVRKLQKSGFYVDTDLSSAYQTTTDIQDAKDDLSGQRPGINTGLRQLIEMHCDLDLEGFEAVDEAGEPTGIALPYVVTIDRDSGKVLGIRRNWAETDPLKRKRTWFTHYKFLPGLGFYGFGLAHVLGNLQKTATATMRSLIDAGTFANLPAGFKARGMRIEGGDKPLKFGEFRDVEGYGDDINKSIVPIPFKEPSQTLFLLLGRVIDDGRRLAAVSDINATDMNNEAPVGSTLAVMEQGIKVMSAIHKRLHRAQRAEFKILARVNFENLPDEYPYNVEDGQRVVFKQDFDQRVDVLPVSDPNIFSESQRIMRAQTQLQLAQQFPQQHDLYEALRRMHEVIGTTKIDQVLSTPRGAKPMDPATELFSVMNNAPVKAYAHQDHNAHIQTHMAQMQLLQGLAMQNPMLQQAGPSMLAHIAEHQAFLIRQQMEALSGPLNPAPDYDKANPGHDDGYIPLDPMMEQMIAQRQALAAQQLAAQQQQLAAQQQLQDPMMQMAMQKLQNETTKVQADAAAKQAKVAIDQQKVQHETTFDYAKLQQDATLEREQMQADMQTVVLNQNNRSSNDGA